MGKRSVWGRHEARRGTAHTRCICDDFCHLRHRRILSSRRRADTGMQKEPGAWIGDQWWPWCDSLAVHLRISVWPSVCSCCPLPGERWCALEDSRPRRVPPAHWQKTSSSRCAGDSRPKAAKSKASGSLFRQASFRARRRVVPSCDQVAETFSSRGVQGIGGR